jgi:hypothetical protein
MSPTLQIHHPLLTHHPGNSSVAPTPTLPNKPHAPSIAIDQSPRAHILLQQPSLRAHNHQNHPKKRSNTNHSIFSSLHSIVLPIPCRIINIHKTRCVILTRRTKSRGNSHIPLINKRLATTSENAAATTISRSSRRPAPDPMHFLVEYPPHFAYNRPRIEPTVAGKGSFRINKFGARGSVSFRVSLHLSS